MVHWKKKIYFSIFMLNENEMHLSNFHPIRSNSFISIHYTVFAHLKTSLSRFSDLSQCGWTWTDCWCTFPTTTSTPNREKNWTRWLRNFKYVLGRNFWRQNSMLMLDYHFPFKGTLHFNINLGSKIRLDLPEWWVYIKNFWI